MTTTQTQTSATLTMAATNLQSPIPSTLRYRPLPAPLETNSSALPIKRQTPNSPVPCRRCLQDSKVGDQMLLLSYDPFLGDSPYRCASPIYVHESPECKLAPFESSGGILPEQQRIRQLSVRAYDKEHMLKAYDVVQGDDLIKTCEKMFSDSDAEYAHVHYAGPGCFAVRIDKVLA